MLNSIRFIPRDSVVGASTEDGDAKASNKKRKHKSGRSDSRMAAGLDWMLNAPERSAQVVTQEPPEEIPTPQAEEGAHPRELNPYLKNEGNVSPSEVQKRHSIPPTAGVGDGGASWRLKALKRAQEQAAREGRRLDEVVEERWGSLASIASSVTSKRAAHANAHFHAMRDRKKTHQAEKQEQDSARPSGSQSPDKEVRIDRHARNMKEPRLNDALRWKSKQRDRVEKMRPEDAAFLKTALSTCNRYENDGSFLNKFNVEQKSNMQQKHDVGESANVGNDKVIKEQVRKDSTSAEQPLNSNQIAARAMKLRLAGKLEEAEELMKQCKNSTMEEPKSAEENNITETVGRHSQHGSILKRVVAQGKYKAENQSLDEHLASKISRNKQYKGSSSVDDEYDFDGDMGTEHIRRNQKRGEKLKGDNRVASEYKRIVTQQERCQYCFENPSRPKYLVIAIGNHAYLMLPPRSPLVFGHCYIVPMQHEGSTRSMDDNVWDEIRNFKKCLVNMFKTQDKDVIFMETVMGLARQKRHCLIECIPVPPDAAKEAPLYFKKGIDEAEDEWSQHNAKKLIDTRGKSLRVCIPKNFPYFHVEFGMQGGFCHVIDDESTFRSQFGRDILIGLLELPGEEMHQNRRHESQEKQIEDVRKFLKMWNPFDWTKMLE